MATKLGMDSATHESVIGVQYNQRTDWRSWVPFCYPWLHNESACNSCPEWKKLVMSVNSSSPRRSGVSELGSLRVGLSKKCLRARRPSPLGMTVQRDLISIIKISSCSPKKSKRRVGFHVII